MTENTAGRFVWRELMTTDANAASGFYGELFNWGSHTMEMGEAGPYTLLKRGDEQIGGIATLPEKANVPPHWVSYITVDDVAAKIAQVEGLGGKVHVPATQLPVGEFAIVSDPHGAAFALFKSNTPGATDTESRPSEHEFCWQQLMTRDVNAAVAFYTEVFGWTASKMPDGETTVLSRGDQMVATALAYPAEAVGMQPHWLNYVAVADVDASTARATKLGGQVFKEPTDIPGMGRFSVLGDPAGAMFALWYQDPNAQT